MRSVNFLIAAPVVICLCALPQANAQLTSSHQSKTTPPDPDRSIVWQSGPTPEVIKAVALIDAGQQALDAGKLDDALENFQNALKIDRHLIPANMGVGDIYFARQQYPEAIAAYQAASTSPTDTDAQFRLALVYSHMRRYSDAAEAYQHGLSGTAIPHDIAPAFYATISPQSRDMPTMEGIIWLYRGWKESSALQDAKAVPLYQQAIQAKPDLAEAHLMLGIVLDRTNHRDEAQTEFAKAKATGIGATATWANRLLK